MAKAKVKQFAPKNIVNDLFTESDEKEPLKDIEEFPELKRDAGKLNNAVTRYSELHQKVKALEEQKKEFSDYIMSLLEKNDVARVRIAGHPVRIVKTGHTSLSKELLLKAGVAPKVISKCEVFIPHKDHVRVDPLRKNHEAE